MGATCGIVLRLRWRCNFIGDAVLQRTAASLPKSASRNRIRSLLSRLAADHVRAKNFDRRIFPDLQSRFVDKIC
jgi:hypothetical protein